MKRGFEIVSKALPLDLELPQRATQQAAGYDLASSVDMTLPSIWKRGFFRAIRLLAQARALDEEQLENAQKILKPVLIPTGIKAYMQPDEVLVVANRSSNPLKRSLVIPNGIGIIDADYYNNEKNEGEIFVQMVNVGLTDRKIKKGERIAQGIFMPYLRADQEKFPTKKRQGGFGSSGK